MWGDFRHECFGFCFPRWTMSQAKKDNVEEDIAKYDGKWSLEEPQQTSLEGDLGLVLKVGTILKSLSVAI